MPRRGQHGGAGCGVGPGRIEHHADADRTEKRLSNRGADSLRHLHIRSADKDGGLAQRCATAGEHRPVHQRQNSLWRDTAIREQHIHAGIYRHDRIKRARLRVAIQLQKHASCGRRHGWLSKRVITILCRTNSRWLISEPKPRHGNAGRPCYGRPAGMRCYRPAGSRSGPASSADGAADKVMDDFVHYETADYESVAASLDAMPAALGNPWRFPRAAKWTKVMDDFVHVKIRSHGTDGLRSPCRRASRSRLACHASRWRWRPWWPRSCTDRSSCRRLPASG